MKILITGAVGYLGRGLIIPFEDRSHTLRLMDLNPFPSEHEVLAGNVADLDTVRAAVQGMDAIVVAHMARNPDAYREPALACDTNIKGTANLFFAAQECGVRKCVLILSTGAVAGYGDEAGRTHTQRPKAGKGLYSATKACQEILAGQFSAEHGISIAALRVGYVMDADTLRDKYGREVARRSPWLTDRRDIGEVACLCLEREDIAYEVFNVMSTPESLAQWDVAHTCQRLNWSPRYDFSWLPLATP